jgi:biotin carboxylase
MKKILLLGGSAYILPVIEAIHNLGYYAITCDYLPDNVAHKFSDEYHNVSIIDKDAVLALAKELKVDGVMSFACDPGVETAAYVSEKLGLPTNPYKSVEILQNKAKFRDFLAKNGFNVPKAKGYTSWEDAQADAAYYNWPVIIKPTDSAGSKGVTKIYEEAQIKEAAEYAMGFSKTRSFIIEEFIEKEGHSSDTDCFSINGELVFCSFSDQRFDANAANPYTPSAYSWPSTMPEECQKELRSELQRLFKLLELKTSIFNVETRLSTNGKTYIMEVSPRGGGNRLSEVLRWASGTDLITNAVRASVGDEILGITSDPIYNGAWAEVILHSEEDGSFVEIEIDPDLEKHVEEKQIWVSTGDAVHKFTGANFAIGTLLLKFDDQQELTTFLEKINEYVRVKVK